MRRSSKKGILITIIVGFFLLAGCNKFSFEFLKSSDADKSASEVTPIVEEDNEATISEGETKKTDDSSSIDSSSSTQSSTPTPAPIQPIANIKLPIYIVNTDTAEVEPITALVSENSEITPEIIVDTVIDSMADQSIIIEKHSVSTKGNAVIVSFDKDKSPASDESYEASILDAIALSLIENLEDYNQVIYRMEEEAYESSHFELGIDEVYLGDN